MISATHSLRWLPEDDALWDGSVVPDMFGFEWEVGAPSL